MEVADFTDLHRFYFGAKANAASMLLSRMAAPIPPTSITYVMSRATYTASKTNEAWQLALNERHLYGSRRLGILRKNQDIILAESSNYPLNLPTVQSTNTNSYSFPLYDSGFELPTLSYPVLPATSAFYQREHGFRDYELTNHLGNVMVVLSDRKYPIQSSSTTGSIAFYQPDVRSANDYYAFGGLMPGRKWDDPEQLGDYRFGFNGQTKEDEINGDGNSYDFGARIYESRLGKFFSTDPAKSGFSFETSYCFAGNTPIWAIDKEGEKIYFVGSAIANKALNEAFDVLCATTSGKHLLDLYNKSNTHDIYFQMNDFLPTDKAVAVTRENANDGLDSKGRLSLKKLLNNASEEEFKEIEAELKYFNNLDVSRSRGRKISLISFNNVDWNSQRPDYDKYALAEALYHEIFAHVYGHLPGDVEGRQEHKNYGKAFYGFYLEKTGESENTEVWDNLNGTYFLEHYKDKVPIESKAFDIMFELLTLKERKEGKLNKEESTIVKEGKKKAKKRSKINLPKPKKK